MGTAGLHGFCRENMGWGLVGIIWQVVRSNYNVCIMITRDRERVYNDNER